MTEANDAVKFKSKLKLTFADQAIEKDFQAIQLSLNTRLVRLTMFVVIVLYSVYYFILLPIQAISYQAEYLIIYNIVVSIASYFIPSPTTASTPYTT